MSKKKDLYYVQDSRSYVGNDVLWWAKDGCGYTTNIKKAHVYDKEQAVRMNRNRSSDIPWPKRYIDDKIQPTVDMQRIETREALRGTGIKLSKPKKYRSPPINCNGCGRFIRESEMYHGCSNCGGDNHP